MYKIIQSNVPEFNKNYVNNPLLITNGKNSNVLPIGTKDLPSIQILDENTILVFADNQALDYFSLTLYTKHDLKYISSAFIQGDHIDNLGLREKFEDGSSNDLINAIFEYDLLTYNPPMNAKVVYN